MNTDNDGNDDCFASPCTTRTREEIESFAKPRANAVDVALEKHGRVLVRSAHHLRKVNQRRHLLVVDHQVELVEIAVNQTVLGDAHNQIHQLVVEARRMLQVPHLGAAANHQMRVCTERQCQGKNMSGKIQKLKHLTPIINIGENTRICSRKN